MEFDEFVAWVMAENGEDPTSLKAQMIEASRYKSETEKRLQKILEKTRKQSISYVFITPKPIRGGL